MGGNIALTWLSLKNEDPVNAEQRLLRTISEMDAETVNEMLYDTMETVAENYTDSTEVDEVPFKEATLLLIGAVKEGFKRIPYRDVAELSIGGYSVYMTGGMSWGDSPTDSFDSIQHLGNIVNWIDSWRTEQ